MATERRIPIRIANKKAYVWDIDDIAIIRSKHHICGILVGTLPHLSQQNVFLGIPLLLMPEEVVLLVENDLAVLINDPRAHPEPHIQQIQKWNAEQQEAIKGQIALAEAKNVKENGPVNSRSTSEEALQKRRAREEKRLAQAAKTTETAAVSEFPTPLLMHESEPVSHDAPVDPGIQSAAASIPHTVVIPGASSSLEWYNPDAHAYTTIEAAKAADVWDYPSTLQERARCGVFRDLWEQGYFMGGGIKFGGDYLVYPGDPLRYHSHFAASILESSTCSLRPMEIVAHGRLGTATKKAHLLCGWNDEKKDVSFLSIEWAGFG